jgi:hypothetical protein
MQHLGTHITSQAAVVGAYPRAYRWTWRFS